MIIFVITLGLLFDIFLEYYLARHEYETVRQKFVSEKENLERQEEEDFVINWEELLKQNPDVVGWIRFYPEPREISYPILQGRNNEEYLHKTISGEKRTAGSIFLNSGNKKDFTDAHSIVFGHRMRDGSMFRHLSDYESTEFFETFPYFYIYLPTGEKKTYLIYSVEIVTQDHSSYQTAFDDREQFLGFFESTKKESMFQRNELKDELLNGPITHVVTLSTCTAASDEHRLVVRGIERGQ